MMNRKKVWKYLLILCLMTGFISSCGKEEGCTDATAANYDAEAEEDDGSCIYDTASCSDGIQNQDETGIDCGGVCASCGTPNTVTVQLDGNTWETGNTSVTSGASIVITAIDADNSRLELTIADDALGAHDEFTGKYIPEAGGAVIYVTGSTDPTSLQITESGSGKLSGTFSGIFKYSDLQGNVMSVEFSEGSFYQLDY